MGYGWRIDELLGKQNEFIDDELESKIIKHFEEHGVYKMASVEGLLRELGGMLKCNRRADPVDEINLYIDQLLESDLA